MMRVRYLQGQFNDTKLRPDRFTFANVSLDRKSCAEVGENRSKSYKSMDAKIMITGKMVYRSP